MSMNRERRRQAIKVLLADDDPNILALAKFNLELDGFDVVVADDGHRALEQARSASLDLIVLDLMLPGLSGLEVLAALKADEATMRIPVFMLTARTAPADRQAAVEAGASGYLTKPFDPEALTKRLLDFCGEGGESFGA